MLFLHTVFSISMYRTFTIMFSETNLIYSKYSFFVTMVTQCPSTSGICIKENILQQISHNATVIKMMIFSTKSTKSSENFIYVHFLQENIIIICFLLYFLCSFDLRPYFMIWLIWAHFGHDHPYHINDYMRPIHHRAMK